MRLLCPFSAPNLGESTLFPFSDNWPLLPPRLHISLRRYISLLEDVLNTNLQLLQIIKLMCGILYLAHLLRCFWFMVGINSSAGDDLEFTWLERYDRWSTGSPMSVGVWEQYLIAVYWALTTLTTVGYGDITPVNDAERGYALFSQLTSALVFGYLISNVTSMVSSF